MRREEKGRRKRFKEGRKGREKKLFKEEEGGEGAKRM